MSTAALRQADSSRRRLRVDYRDALIISRNGEIRRMERIDVLGPRGNNWLLKVLSLLTRDWHIAVQLSDHLDMPLAEVKALIARCLENADRYFDSFAPDILAHSFALAVQQASSVAAIVALFQLPPPEDSLDLL